eukprot:7392683-Lingulodinium_polyedra.AAC.1
MASQCCLLMPASSTTNSIARSPQHPTPGSHRTATSKRRRQVQGCCPEDSGSTRPRNSNATFALSLAR